GRRLLRWPVTAPSAGARRRPAGTVAFRRVPRRLAAVEFYLDGKRPPPRSPRARRKDCRHDEGPRHGAGHGLVVAGPARLLSRRRVVDPLPNGMRRQVVAKGGKHGLGRFLLPGASDGAGVSKRRTFSPAGFAHLQRRSDL